MRMPKFLKETLQDIGETTAEEWWKYLDSTPHASSQMIEVIAKSHPQVTKKLCGSDELPKKGRGK